MRQDADWARARFAAARVARLATADAHGAPHIVPFVFVVEGDVICFAVDAKPKASRSLKRLANIAANPRVSVLVDEYAEDWTQLWWARADGTARVIDDDARARRLLTAHFRQYVEQPPPGPVVAITVARWSGWSATRAA